MRPTGIAASLEKIKTAGQRGDGSTLKTPSIEVHRQIWRAGADLGKIVIIDGPQEGEAHDIRCGVVVSTDDGRMIRVPMTKQFALNLSRTLLESVT